MTTCYNFKKWELAMQEEGKGISRTKRKGSKHKQPSLAQPPQGGKRATEASVSGAEGGRGLNRNGGREGQVEERGVGGAPGLG